MWSLILSRLGCSSAGQRLVFDLSIFFHLLLFGPIFFQSSFFFACFHPILNEFFGPVELLFFYGDCSEVCCFVVFGVNFILYGEQVLSDATIRDFELFVFLALGDFFEGISIEFEHGSDFDQSLLILKVEFFEHS